MSRAGTGRHAVGIIVPSANIVVERTAIRFAAGTPGLDFLFARVPVRGDADPSLRNYDVDAYLRAAELLCDARPDILLWAGSMGVLVGIDEEERLRERVELATGLPFTSSTFALLRLAECARIKRIGLVTPYATAYQERLADGFAALGFDCISEEHTGLVDNLSYAMLGEEEIVRMALAVSTARPDAVLAWCTNLAAADCAGRIEAATGLPFHDATMLGLIEAADRVTRQITAASDGGH